jgi:formate/nitrite transporter
MFSPNEVAANVIGIGKKKASTPSVKLFCLGILAGMFIALAAVGANTASSVIENASLAKLIAGCVFPVGLAMTLVAGSELFTGNSLIIVSVLEKETRISGMLRNWVCVYLGNFVGSLFIAWACNAAGQFNLFGGALALTTIKTAAAKASLSFGKAILLGVLCNFLVCIAVWISFAGKTVACKIIGLFMPIMLFVLAGFEHSVANMYYIPAGLFAAANPAYAEQAAQVSNIANLTWGNFFVSNLLPVTIGNVVLVGCMYWFIYLHKSKAAVTAK